MGKVFAALSCMAMLSGCVSYSVAGLFEGANTEFSGTVTVGAADSGSLNVRSSDGALTCTGTSQVTRRGAFTTNIGAQGRAEATCNDGRTFKVDFVQLTESGGRGQGIDSQGNIITLFFDHSATAVQARMERARLDNLVQ